MAADVFRSFWPERAEMDLQAPGDPGPTEVASLD